MTLNIWKDGVATTRSPNEFQLLKNYIPARGEIRTREGITLFTHTPDMTNVWTPETPGQTWPTDPPVGDFGRIMAVFPFNTTASIGNELLSGDLVYSALGDLGTGGSGHAFINTVDLIEGAGSLMMDDNIVRNPAGDGRVWGMRTLNAFPSYMPGDPGETTNKFLITYWIKPYTAAASSNAEWHFTFGNDTSGLKQAAGFRHFDDKLQSFWYDSGASTLGGFDIASIVVPNQWQFVAAWFDGDTGFDGLYHYNASTFAENYQIATRILGVPKNHFYHHSAANTVNGDYAWNVAGSANYTNAAAAFHGLIDYCTMWSQPMHINNSSNITLVRMVRDMSWLL